MKNIFLLLCFISLSFSYLSAQDDPAATEGKDELKLNLFNLVAFEYLDASYERIIDEESSFGVAGLISLGDNTDTFNYLREFSLTPYYRRYFSKGYAKGIFVEAFGMLNQSSDEFYIRYDEIAQQDIYDTEKYTDFAVGVSVGGKFISKKGFVAEIYAGIGRNLVNSDNIIDVVGRGGISLGFRF